jgi:serine phosphatase RsbU (regulator of sigma subunit)
MADLKITKKHHPTGSVTRRILTVAIFLLVIPLFLQSLFLYLQEYDQKLDDVKDTLTVFAKERAHFIKEIVEIDWAVLEAGQNSNVKRFYIKKIPLPPRVAGEFVIVSKNQRAILVGLQDSATSALTISIPFSIIGRDIPSNQPICISLIDSKGQTVWQNMKFAEKADLIQVKEPIAKTGLSLQVSMEKKRVPGLHVQSYYFHFATLVLFVGVIGGGAVYLLTRRIARPLRDLCKTMERVSVGASHARYKPDRMGFEINELGLQFNETLDGLLYHSQEAAKERLRREKLAEELRIGHEIQSNLLPSKLTCLPGIDLATAYHASKEVNGDFYDFFQLENGKLLLTVCDTAGKGISACLFSLGLRSIIRSMASVTSDVADLIRRVNDLYLVDAHESAMFSTLWLGMYDPTEKTLRYCSQGHPPALLRRGQNIEELQTLGIALGAQQIDVVETKEILLEAGDLLLLYTDGVIEAHNLDDQLFGKQRLVEFVLRKKSGTSQQIAKQLVEEIHLFSQGKVQHDDITLLVMRV